MNEMSEAVNIINQVIHKLIIFSNKNKNSKSLKPHFLLNALNGNYYNNHKIKNNYNSMENLINHFKY